MISLPPITLASDSIGLPLSEDSARQIAAIFLHEDAAKSPALWAEVLAVDPPLLLWVALLHARSRQPQPESLAELSQWLSPKALILLDWSHEADSPAELAHAEAIFWRDLVQKVLTQVESIASHDLNSPNDPVFFHGTIAAVIGAVASSELVCPLNELPGWLHSFCHDVPKCSESRLDSENLTPETKRALRRWRTKTTGSGGMLPRLTQRLRRLQALEADYEHTLRRERLSAIRELAYGASHEINNPLANISTRAQSLLQEEHDPERRRKLATIHLQALRAHEMIANLMHFAKPPKLHMESVDLGECLAVVIDELAEWSHSQGTSVHFDPPSPPCLVAADRQQLLIALRAVIRNSLEALGAGGRIDATLTMIESEEESQQATPFAVARIRDNGPGIDPEILPRVFDPFFSGREAGRGLGFGLAWCWRIVERHAGRIEVESEPGHGTQIAIHLPLAAEPAIITPAS